MGQTNQDNFCGLTKEEAIHHRELGKKLFNGDMFKIFTKEEEESEDFIQYQVYVKTRQEYQRNLHNSITKDFLPQPNGLHIQG